MKAPRVVPSWDSYYIGLAFMIASRSKDPSTQCGSLIINSDNIPMGLGYNGASRLVNDNEIDWSRPNKYKHIIHAEINAINHCKADITGCTLYVTGIPCSKCMEKLVEVKIKRVVYGRNLPVMCDEEDRKICLDRAKKGNVLMEEYSEKIDWLSNRIEHLKKFSYV